MSDPSRFWISIARSGESSTMAPSRWERKVTPLSVDLAQLRERHDLEAAGIGQDRMRPVHERVQAAERGNALGAGAQHQVVGVGEYDVCAGRAHGFGRKTFHRRLRADRHEGGRRDQPVRGRDLAAAGGAVGRQQAEGKECVVRRRRR